MINILELQNSEFVQKHRSLIFKAGLMGLPAVYLLWLFLRALGCGQVGGCTLNDFTPVFPFYALLALVFSGKLNFLGYLLLYIVSAAFYLVIFYRIAGWVENKYHNFSHRPKFGLKRA